MSAPPPQHAKPIPALEELSLDQKIGQLFIHPGNALFMAESSEAYQQFLHAVRDNQVGGIIWFVSNVYETAHLTRELQAVARIPLLVSADLEAGPGMRFTDTTYWPPAMAVAATGDPSLAEAEGRIVAREAAALGVNHILAPVADVNIDPDNPVINARSFGEDPQEVSRYVAAFIRGVQSQHVLATAKHFPGHGDTHVDSHRALPVIEATRARLDTVELVPFRAAIDVGVHSVMIGHLAVPALDSEPVPVRAAPHEENPYGTHASEVPQHGTLPATISVKIVDGLLRRELGYDGLVVSDAFNMGGITEHFEAGEAAVLAFEAGIDQVMVSADPDAAIAAVKSAVQSGRLSEERIDQSVRRILAAKSLVGSAVAEAGQIFRIIDSQEDRDVASDIARRAITLVREQPGTLPLHPDVKVLLVTVTDGSPTSSLANLEDDLRWRLEHSIEVAALDARSRDEDLASILSSAERVDLVLLALAVRARSGSGEISLPDAAIALVARLPPQTRTLAIAFGTPYMLREVPSVGTYLCAYGPQPVLQSAALDAIFGEHPITGRLPVRIPGFYPIGHGIRK
ncbi:MAG: glycoside hydrolase family 3 N-terminal domain-containing protein [Thermoanaerobaculia bacterium]